MTERIPKVVIVGGGFGGLAAAAALKKAPAQVTLIDRANHHVFQPLLYQVATSILTPGQIASPIREVVGKQKNVTVLLGDTASLDQDGKPLPGVAQVAIQQGRYVGKLIRLRINGSSAPPPFRYFDKGNMAVVGRGFALLESGRFSVSGFLVWIIWATVHVQFLALYSLRLSVFAQWVWTFITGQRGSRLIVDHHPWQGARPDASPAADG